MHVLGALSGSVIHILYAGQLHFLGGKLAVVSIC